jgi:hypothetical protein
LPSIVIPAQKLKWDQGLDSPNRGDGRWISSVAEMLRDMKWDVDILCDREHQEDEHIHFTKTPSQEKYDAAFYLYKLSDDELMDADRHWLGVFDRRSAPDDSRFTMVTPYRSYPGFYRLPLAYKDKFHLPKFEWKKIIWATKDPLAEDVKDIALEWLDALYKLASRGYEVKIMNADHFKHYGYQLPNQTNVNLIFSGEAQHFIDVAISHSSILIPLRNISSAHRAVPRGVVPVPLNNVLDFYSEDTVNLVKQGLQNGVFWYLLRLLEDEEYYKMLCKEMQTKCGVADLASATKDIETLMEL